MSREFTVAHTRGGEVFIRSSPCGRHLHACSIRMPGLTLDSGGRCRVSHDSARVVCLSELVTHLLAPRQKPQLGTDVIVSDEPRTDDVNH